MTDHFVVHFRTVLSVQYHCNIAQWHVQCLFTFAQDDPEIPFTETDFRRRKAHPNFKEHIAAEKLVTKLGKTVRTRSDNGSGQWVMGL